MEGSERTWQWLFISAIDRSWLRAHRTRAAMARGEGGERSERAGYRAPDVVLEVRMRHLCAVDNVVSVSRPIRTDCAIARSST